MERYDISLMDLNSLVSAIPSRMRQYVRCMEQAQDNTLKKLEATCCTAKSFYRDLMRVPKSVTVKAELWEKELNRNMTTEEFLSLCQNIYGITNYAKYRSFQYRLLHRAVITNIHLMHWKMRETNLCSFCNTAKETYGHLFYECTEVKPMWGVISDLATSMCDVVFNFNKENVLLNNVIDNICHVVNFLCLILKQYIYRKRCLNQKLCAPELIRTIYSVRNMEKYIAIKNNKLGKHCKKWCLPVQDEEEGEELLPF